MQSASDDDKQQSKNKKSAKLGSETESCIQCIVGLGQASQPANERMSEQASGDNCSLSAASEFEVSQTVARVKERKARLLRVNLNNIIITTVMHLARQLGNAEIV